MAGRSPTLVTLAGKRLDEVRIPMPSTPKVIYMLSFPAHRVVVRDEGERLTLTLPAALLAYLYYSGTLTSDRSKPVALALDEGPTFDCSIEDFVPSETRTEITLTLRCLARPAQIAALTTNVVPFTQRHERPRVTIDEDDAEDDVPPSYLQGGRIAPALLAEFFEAALEFRRGKPWKQLSRFSGVFADIPAWQCNVAVMTVDDEGRGGLGIFLDTDIFLESVEADANAEPWLPYCFLAIGFFTRRELPDAMFDEMIELGLAPKRGPYPSMTRFDEVGAPRAPTSSDYELAIVLLRVIKSYSKRMCDGVFETKLAGERVRVELEAADEVADGFDEDIPF